MPRISRRGHESDTRGHRSAILSDVRYGSEADINPAMDLVRLVLEADIHRATPGDSGKQEGKLSGLVETFHAARYLRLDRRCHIRGHLSG